MIKFQRISTQDKEYYQFMEQLMITSFPSEEYRDLDELKQYTDHQPLFHCNIIHQDNQPIGLMNYWDFDDFCYVEHFAIDPSHRNGGIGKQCLNQLCQELAKPVVLEVEHPTEEMAQRRIQFYQRQGFKLWDKPYIQPPYKKGEDFLPLLIMAYGDIDADKNYENIRLKLYKEVYNVE